MRTKLSDERKSITHRFKIDYTVDPAHPEICDGYITVGFYKNGQPGEVFLRVGNVGSNEHAYLDALAVAVSIGLQSGVPIETYVNKFSHVNAGVMGRTSNPEIPRVTSTVDYVGKWLGLKFGKKQ